MEGLSTLYERVNFASPFHLGYGKAVGLTSECELIKIKNETLAGFARL